MFTDVASGTSLRRRTGLLSAVELACRDKTIDIFFVHRLDRLARDMFTYLTIKGRLHRHGVKIVSAVENCDPTPVGQFIERIMAAQAEFYSANLSQQVKCGIEERLRRGNWFTLPPLGYVKINGEVQIDPARGQFVTVAFERWASGAVTAALLAEELHQAGLVSRRGQKVKANKLCGILHNPFYTGKMLVAGKEYPGNHAPLVTTELFGRCEEVFRQKHSGGQPRRHLHFLLSRKLVCPKCLGFLVGEEHLKHSGKIYRYYRCHRAGCRFIVRGEALEDQVKTLLAAHLTRDTVRLKILETGDAVERKRLFDQLVDQVQLDKDQPRLVLRSTVGSKT